MTPYII